MSESKGKYVYIVRHGETEGNKRNAIQDGTDMLSEEGRMQAERIAVRAQSIDFEAMIASDYIRAIDTAESIARATGKTFTTSPHFREVAHPSAFVGMPRSDARFGEYQAAQKANVNDPAWHFADEENFFDLAQRAHKAEAELREHPASSLLVVSHANFIKCLVSHMLLEEMLTPEMFTKLRYTLLISNVGLTVMKYAEERWHLVTWNDHSHLA